MSALPPRVDSRAVRHGIVKQLRDSAPEPHHDLQHAFQYERRLRLAGEIELDSEQDYSAMADALSGLGDDRLRGAIEGAIQDTLKIFPLPLGQFLAFVFDGVRKATS